MGTVITITRMFVCTVSTLYTLYILTLIIFTEDPEGLLELVLGVRVADLLVHEVAELGELHKPGPVNINLKVFTKCRNFNIKLSHQKIFQFSNICFK